MHVNNCKFVVKIGHDDALFWMIYVIFLHVFLQNMTTFYRSALRWHSFWYRFYNIIIHYIIIYIIIYIILSHGLSFVGGVCVFARFVFSGVAENINFAPKLPVFVVLRAKYRIYFLNYESDHFRFYNIKLMKWCTRSERDIFDVLGGRGQNHQYPADQLP